MLAIQRTRRGARACNRRILSFFLQPEYAGEIRRISYRVSLANFERVDPIY